MSRLEVLVSYFGGDTADGVVKGLDGDQALKVAFGVIDALAPFTKSYVFTHTDEESDTYTLLLRLTENASKDAAKMDNTIQTVITFTTAYFVG